MSNVVQFLEALALSPNPLSAEEFEVAVTEAGLNPATRKALLEQDMDALFRTIGGRLKMMCIIAPAENDEPQEGDQPDSEEEAPEQDASVRAA